MATPPDPPAMSDPPTPEELEAMREYNRSVRGDLQVQAETAATAPPAIIRTTTLEPEIHG